MTDKRIRDKVLALRFTDSEKKYILDKANDAGMSTNDFLLECSQKTKIQPPADLSGIVYELKMIGNNVNQLAMRANTGVLKLVYLDEVRNQLSNIYEKLMELSNGNS